MSLRATWSRSQGRRAGPSSRATLATTSYPEGLFEATEGNKKRIEAESRARSVRDQAERTAAERVAAALGAVALTLKGKAGEEGKLFGSITAQDIAEALAAQGHEVDRRRIELEHPIKTIGHHTVGVRLHSEVRAEVHVAVVAGIFAPDDLGIAYVMARGGPLPLRRRDWWPRADEINGSTSSVPTATPDAFRLTLRGRRRRPPALGDASLPYNARTRRAPPCSRPGIRMMRAHSMGFAESLGEPPLGDDGDSPGPPPGRRPLKILDARGKGRSSRSLGRPPPGGARRRRYRRRGEFCAVDWRMSRSACPDAVAHCRARKPAW